MIAQGLKVKSSGLRLSCELGELESVGVATQGTTIDAADGGAWVKMWCYLLKRHTRRSRALSVHEYGR